MSDILARLRAWLFKRPEFDRGGGAGDELEPPEGEVRIPRDVYLAQKIDELPERVVNELEDRD